MTAPILLAPLPAEEHDCGGCGFAYAATSIDAALDVIEAVPRRISSVVLAVSDGRLRVRPDGSTWSALEYVCHLRDVYAVYTIRLYRARTEDSPRLEPMFNDLRAFRFRYNQRDIGSVVAEVADNVVGFLDEAARNSGTAWERPVRRLVGEERTARWLVRQAAHEGLHHWRDIRAVLDHVTTE